MSAGKETLGIKVGLFTIVPYLTFTDTFNSYEHLVEGGWRKLLPDVLCSSDSEQT